MQSAPKADEGESLPSWFVPKRFLEEHFDAEAYVADLRRFVSFLCPAPVLLFKLCSCGRGTADMTVIHTGAFGSSQLPTASISQSSEGQACGSHQ